MEEEKYIKCTGCNSVSGMFVNDEQSLNIECGTCDEVKEFVIITKEEFDELIINEDE